MFKPLSEDGIHQEKMVGELIVPNVALLALEKDKIKEAICTDFVLSAEIIMIALGTVKVATFALQITVISAIAIIMTIGVYGLVY
jgi:predicted DNA repair protein MutK